MQHIYVLCVCIVNHGRGYWVAMQHSLSVFSFLSVFCHDCKIYYLASSLVISLFFESFSHKCSFAEVGVTASLLECPRLFYVLWLILIIVTYTPSAQPSIKKQAHPVEDIKIYPWLWTGWIGCKCDAHRKQVGVKQWYNLVRQIVRVSWKQLEIRCCRENQHPAEGYGPSGPPIEQPSRTRKKCC